MANKKKTTVRTNKKLTTNKRINEQTRVSATYKQFRLTATAASSKRFVAKIEKCQQPIKSKEVSEKIKM